MGRQRERSGARRGRQGVMDHTQSDIRCRPADATAIQLLIYNAGLTGKTSSVSAKTP